MKFRKKPVVIEAVRWGVPEGPRLPSPEWLKAAMKAKRVVKASGRVALDLPDVLIDTLEGVMLCKVGDWIIQGVNGELYPCKNDIFEKTYERVQEESDG